MAMAMACCHPVVVPAPAAVSSVSSLSSAAAASQSPASFTPSSIRSPFKPLSLPANRHHLRAFVIRAAAAEGKEPSDSPPSQKQKSMVPIKPTKKQQVTLRFVWMEKNIGLALDQVVPGYGTIPLSPYYFWPRKDAWEELKTKLESKKWISRKQTILLLNQATDIINLWQQNAASM